MAKKQKQIAIPTVTLTGKSAMVAGVAVALLLLIIGATTETEGVAYAGIFILPLTLLCGGLFLTEETTPIRVTLLVFSGLLLLGVASAAVTGATIFGMF